MSKRIIDYKCDFCNVELKAYKMISFICPNCGELLWPKDKGYSDTLNLRTKKVSEDDVEKMKNNTEKIKRIKKIIVKDEFIGIKNIMLKMIELLKDANTDFSIKAIIVAAFGYLLFPMDIIPDMIPIFGYLDDIAIIMMAAKLISDSIGYNVENFQIKRKNIIKMGIIIYRLVAEDKNLEYNYVEEKGYKLWIIKSGDLKRYNLRINDNVLTKDLENYVSHPYINKTLLPMKEFDSIIAESILNEYKEFARILGAKSIEINTLDSNEDSESKEYSGKMKYKVKVESQGKMDSKVNSNIEKYSFEEFGRFDKVHLDGIYNFMWIFTDLSFYDNLLESRINNNLLRQKYTNKYSTSGLIKSDIRTSINKKNSLKIKIEISKYVNRNVEISIDFFELPKEIKEDGENIIKEFHKIMELRREQLEQSSVL